MSYKQKTNPTKKNNVSKKKMATSKFVAEEEVVSKRKINRLPLDEQVGFGQEGSGPIVDLIFKVAPHLLAPLAEAVGTRIGKFVRGEGNRLAGNGNRIAGNGVLLAGQQLESVKRKPRVYAKKGKGARIN